MSEDHPERGGSGGRSAPGPRSDEQGRGGSGVRGGWPVRLGDVLAPALERIGPRGVWTEARLRKAWRDAVGEQVSQHAHVRRLRGEVLEVSVSSDAWATELTYLAPAVLERLNEQLGPGTVSQIVVTRERRKRW